MKLKGVWKRIPEWGKAFLLAFTLLLLVHLFVLRWVTVRSTSMYATLLPGDLLGVERWTAWTGLHRGDIIVFHDPVQDDRPLYRRQLLVKRIAGMPGDEVRIRDGQLSINGRPVQAPPGQTARWTMRVKAQANVPEILRAVGLPEDLVLPGRAVFDLPLNAQLAELLMSRPEVASLEKHGSTSRTKGYLFPFGPSFRWNNDNYGPLNIPAAGDTVQVNVYTLPIYDRIISRYESNELAVAKRELVINGAATDRYVIGQDYFFVLGDSRDHSSDSRYWGLVPADHVMGRAGFVLLNANANGSPARKGNWFIGL